jgi:gliding motility-associated-like protein
MKTIYLLIVILTIQNLTAFSQTFEKKDSLQLNFNNVIDGQWADINNDGLLNYVTIFKKVDSVEVGFFSIENDIPYYTSLFSQKGVTASFEIVDLTHDGLLDILFSLKTSNKNTLEIRANNGLLDFTKDVVEIDSVFTKKLISIDLTRNGSKEIVSITEDDTGQILPQAYSFDSKAMNWDTLAIEFSKEITYSDFLNIDIDKDGWDDLIIAGIDSDNQAIIELYGNNEGVLEFLETDLEYSEALSLSKADLDSDGDFEVIFSGKVNDESSLYYYDNNDGVLNKEEFIINPDSILQIFPADFNSDGFIDIILKSNTTGKPTNIPTNILMLNDGNMEFMIEEVKMTNYQDFGDWDWDGDLDIIQFDKKGDFIEVFLLKNTTVDKNEGPKNPSQASAFPQNRKVTILWDSVQDDHTKKSGITYDLYITKEDVTVSPGFDIEKTHRIVVAHGNQNTSTTANYYDLEPGIYNYGVQSVDNSFYAGTGSGNCLRSQFVVCDNIKTHQYILCYSEELTLVTKDRKDGAWFSSINGFLGVNDSLSLIITENEEIYFSVQESLVCEDQELWSFEIKESGDIDLLPDIWACEGDELEFNVGDFWKSVTWQSSIRGDLKGSSNLTYIADQPDTISVNLESNQGCIFNDHFLINISFPELILSGDVFRILKGSSIQLQASGGETYEWSPLEGLSDHLIANPIASPEISTVYNVELTDSIGCKTSSTVQVIVESKAFIPNLFTPNEDQRNDILTIYGLEEVREFAFKIYNRSGALIYESSDSNEVSNKGWDGTKNGKEQPNGVYYWKISGTYKNGTPVYLNGESSGAVHLLR